MAKDLHLLVFRMRDPLSEFRGLRVSTCPKSPLVSQRRVGMEIPSVGGGVAILKLRAWGGFGVTSGSGYLMPSGGSHEKVGGL